MCLEPFNCESGRLSDSRLRRQYLAIRGYYCNLPDDDILKGFRRRAGITAPGWSQGAELGVKLPVTLRRLDILTHRVWWEYRIACQ